MNGKHVSIGFSLYFALSGICLAATPVVQGTLKFWGSIIEPGCASHASEDAAFALTSCPSAGSAPNVNVSHVEPLHSVNASDPGHVNINLSAKSGYNERLREQQYQLVDENGSPIRSGMYLVTLTTP